MTQMAPEKMVCLRVKTSQSTPALRAPNQPPSWRIEVSQPVALELETTPWKSLLKLCITRAWPRTPCWYPYRRPPYSRSQRWQADVRHPLTLPLFLARGWTYKGCEEGDVENTAVGPKGTNADSVSRGLGAEGRNASKFHNRVRRRRHL